MKHIKDIYPLVNEVRKRIIETMQERGLTKVEIIPSREDYEKKHKDDPDYDEFGWDELKSYTCPAITYYNKRCEGLSYDVISVELDMNDDHPRFKLNCVGEFDDDWFYDYDVMGMQGVYEEMEKHLGIDQEPEYVWVFTGEQAYDSDVENVIVRVFATEEAACKFLHDFIHEGDDDESLEDFVTQKGWEVEINEPDLYRAFPWGRYPESHIELTITKCEIENKK